MPVSRRIRPVAVGAVLLVGLCALALVLVPVTGKVRAEAPEALNAPRTLCALDGRCDTVVRVEGVWRSPSAGTAPDRVPADGLFYVVTAEIRYRDGVAEGPAVVARVRDADGRTYDRARDVEALLPPPAPGRVRWVFDLPDWAPAPRLVLHQQGRLNRLTRSVEIPLPTPGI